MTSNDPREKLIECHDHIIGRLSVFSQSLQAIENHGPVGFVSEKENDVLVPMAEQSRTADEKKEIAGVMNGLRNQTGRMQCSIVNSEGKEVIHQILD
jgi:hypothetical protein